MVADLVCLAQNLGSFLRQMFAQQIDGFRTLSCEKKELAGTDCRIRIEPRCPITQAHPVQKQVVPLTKFL